MRSPSISGRWISGLFAGFACLCLASSMLIAQDEAEKAAEAPAASAEKAAEPVAADAAAQPAHTETHAPGDAAHAAGADAHATEHSASGSHAAGAHHDPYDLSHSNAGPDIQKPEQWKADLALATLVVFICLLVLLGKFAWGPLMKGLEEREQRIAANIDEARRSAEMAAAQLRQYEAKLAAATEEAREILNQARRDADAARERILAEAQALAQRERQRAVEDIQTAKNAALQEMTQKSVDLAVSMAGRLVRQQLNREDHAQLIREMIEKLPSHN